MNLILTSSTPLLSRPETEDGAKSKQLREGGKKGNFRVKIRQTEHPSVTSGRALRFPSAFSYQEVKTWNFISSYRSQRRPKAHDVERGATGLAFVLHLRCTSKYQEDTFSLQKWSREDQTSISFTFTLLSSRSLFSSIYKEVLRAEVITRPLES